MWNVWKTTKTHPTGDKYSSFSEMQVQQIVEKGAIYKLVHAIRPRNASEKKAGSSSVIECNVKKGEVQVQLEKATSKTFTFDKVFGPDSKQIHVYKAIAAPLIDEVLTGYNCTVFA